MGNLALVIGIDQYKEEAACLMGAVSDALKMLEWLEAQEGGNVGYYDYIACLAPTPETKKKIPNDLNYVDASCDTVLKALRFLAEEKVIQEADRFFFYFSGHGLMVKEDPTQSGIAFSDFTENRPDKSLSIRALTDFLQVSLFNNLFMFLDGCRDAPYDFKFTLGGISRPLKPEKCRPLGTAAAQLFICHATSPGMKAAELRTDGRERGAFTEVLLNALDKGLGAAKQWERDSGSYIVRWDNLYGYLYDEMERREIPVPNEQNRHAKQLPQEASTRCSSARNRNPELTRFKEDDPRMSMQKLSVLIDPDSVIPLAEMKIYETGGNMVPVKEISQISGLPVPFVLPQRQYTLIAKAAKHHPKQDCWSIPLYDDRKETVAFEPEPPPPKNGSPLPNDPDPFPNPPADPSATCTLTVESADRLASLEIADSSGRPLEGKGSQGNGKITRAKLPAGLYRARLLLPDGGAIEELVGLHAGQTRVLKLAGPPLPTTGVIAEMIKANRFRQVEENTLVLSESLGLGQISGTRLSTVAMLAGSVDTYRPEDLKGSRIRSVGLKEFHTHIGAGDESGVQVLFADEAGATSSVKEYLARVQMRIWPQSAPVPEATAGTLTFSGTDGIAELARPLAPGSYWLAIELPTRGKPLVFSLAALQNRLTMLVFYRGINEVVQTLQYLPLLRPKRNPTAPPGVYLDAYSNPDMLRRLELVQRFYLSGRLDQAANLAGLTLGADGPEADLLDGKWLDPIAGCLGGYLLVAEGRLADLKKPARIMADRFSTVPDGHVLLLLYHAWSGRKDEAKTACRAALQTGVPICMKGVVHLAAASHEYEIDHPSVALLDSIVQNPKRGRLWAGWEPEHYKFGTPL